MKVVLHMEELRLGNLIFHNDESGLVDFATACTKDSSFYSPLRWMDRMAVVWMKAHIFKTATRL